MINFLKSLPSHGKKAVINITRSFGNAASSIFAVTVTLILVMLFTVVAVNIGNFTTNIEKNVQIWARIDTVVDEGEYARIQEEIEAIKHVDKVEFSDSKEELDKMMTSGNGSEDKDHLKSGNPLPAAYYIDATEGKYVESVSKSIEKIDGILDVNFGGDSISTMIGAFEAVRLYGGILAGILCVLAIFLISNTIRLNIYNRREEIAIMRNVGASNGYIKVPFLLEGMIIGFFGAILPIIVTIFGYGFLYDVMNGNFFTPMLKMNAPMPFVIEISILLLVAGVVVGLLGSLLAINKNLKFKR
ncbi:cell division transport system permease protein [Breznakia sp. PF5-3]|uniref:permease-like cell division protein FtsX n=1 Tax=unclassified Breznakia TaxID=2623764 RepID=UPI002404A53E|nr:MULTISPECIES: permease-like cell division protein FtsX [unclassified Breznakia]MDL2276695.1 permease-like cell division protein FtsX [Breznakia sp. OttesenSCG-928-G09]MDF9824039.1 cell division transport system permease protein [Breznakia sp. PM6-1]MDF9834895.1 cell division transport system permease protein [Breznakia sp. PF5-3]MDF9837083.1 cell division transport system permease protein [Breznakia sp. PFB2-8]MDF9859008.1 cell division transport system permease protein [Breznakia sp. PH5-2